MFRRIFSPEWVLRLSLGIMYLYSGIDIVRNPKGWIWALNQLPDNFENLISTLVGLERFLFIQGIGEIVMAAAFLIWFTPRGLVKFFAFLSALEMALIVLLVGLDAITFRDIGLIGSGLALFLLVKRN